MSNLPKWMIIDARSSTKRNDSAKFDDLMWLSMHYRILCTKTLNFHNKNDLIVCIVCKKRVELEWKAEKFSKEVTNGATRRRRHFILEQTAELIMQ